MIRKIVLIAIMNVLNAPKKINVLHVKEIELQLLIAHAQLDTMNLQKRIVENVTINVQHV